MTGKELRRLSRRELLELLIEQAKKINLLREQLDEANAQLASRRILISSAGSIAEAALQLNHIFEDAQAAADQYLENVRAQCTPAAAGDAEKAQTEAKRTAKAEWEDLVDQIIRESEQEKHEAGASGAPRRTHR